MPGTVNPGLSSRGQFGQPIHGYTTAQNYGMPGHQIAQFGGLATRTATAAFPSSQAPHLSGNFVLFILKSLSFSIIK